MLHSSPSIVAETIQTAISSETETIRAQRDALAIELSRWIKCVRPDNAPDYGETAERLLAAMSAGKGGA